MDEDSTSGHEGEQDAQNDVIARLLSMLASEQTGKDALCALLRQPTTWLDAGIRASKHLPWFCAIGETMDPAQLPPPSRHWRRICL